MGICPELGQYYYHMFFKQQPDLNWRNPLVRNAMLDVFRFWLNKGVDGFRLDVFNAYLKTQRLQTTPQNRHSPFDCQNTSSMSPSPRCTLAQRYPHHYTESKPMSSGKPSLLIPNEPPAIVAMENCTPPSILILLIIVGIPSA